MAKREAMRPGWAKWYSDARAEAEFRFGLRRVPVDTWKTLYAQGDSPQEAARIVEQSNMSYGSKVIR